MAEPVFNIVEGEEQDEEYDENADDDFNPDQAGAGEDASSSEDKEAAAPKQTKQPRKRKAETDAVEELDSGDEATIKELKRKRKKKDDKAEEDGESGGEGGFVRTRAQRQAEKVERKEGRRTTVGEVTIDVEDVWAELNKIPVGRPPPPPPAKVVDADDAQAEQEKENAPAAAEYITIRRRVEYAGQVDEVEESVLRSSKEAQQYLQQHPEADPNHKPTAPSESQLRRPLKRPSLFEPNPTATIKGVPPERLRPHAPSRLDILMAEKRGEEERRRKAERMTTVQKSALDWKGYVDTEGLKEELETYGRSKQGYLAREDFLGRADLAREMAGREARLKG